MFIGGLTQNYVEFVVSTTISLATLKDCKKTLRYFQTNFLIEKSALDNGQVSTQIVFFFFLLIGNIVIANLLIGLTVNKTELLFKKASLVRLETMVHQVHGIGQFFQIKSGTPFWRALAQKTKLFDFLNVLVTKGKDDK